MQRFMCKIRVQGVRQELCGFGFKSEQAGRNNQLI